jgi:hypothetical protein
MLVEKVGIPKTGKDDQMDLKGGMKLVLTAEMNILAYTELILSMEDKVINSKVAFNSVNGCKKEISCRWKRKYGLGEVKKQVRTITHSLPLWLKWRNISGNDWARPRCRDY